MLSLAIIQSESQVKIISFQDNGNKINTIDLLDLKNTETHLIIYPKDIEENLEIIKLLQSESRVVPIKCTQNIPYSIEEIEQFSQEDFNEKLLSNIYSNFSLQNNVKLLDQLYTHVEKMQPLLFNDRLSFYEELWYLLKINSASYDCKLIYNGVITKKPKNKKNSDSSTNNDTQDTQLKGDLVQNMVVGPKMPQTKIKDELATNIFNEYKNIVTSKFEIIEYNKKDATFIISGHINESIFMFMAKTFSLSILQEKVMKTLIDGINFKLDI